MLTLGHLLRPGKSQKIPASVIERLEEPLIPTITLETDYLATHYDLGLQIHLVTSSSPATGFPEMLSLNFPPFSIFFPAATPWYSLPVSAVTGR